jgi:hypothetical protein
MHMKKMLLRAAIIFLVIVSATACKNEPEMFIVIDNETSQFRTNEAVVISKATLEDQYGKLPLELIPVLVSEQGDTIPSQADDLDGDGRWDELFFVGSFSPESTTRLKLAFVEREKAPVYPSRTNIRLARIQGDEFIAVNSAGRLKPAEGIASGIFHHEGVGWENDLVGFRNYLDARNGMDIFGKTTGEMILDRAGIGEDYHFMQSWGMDILRVGQSLGAGSLVLEIDGQLHRVAPQADGNVAIVTLGPLRSILRFKFSNWEVEGNFYNITHDVSIHAGSWYYESSVWLNGQTENALLGAGIATIDLSEKEARISEMKENIVIVATHGAQSYDFEKLGMAIMIPGKWYAGTERRGADMEINNSYVVKMKAEESAPVVFRFYSGWEKSDPRFADEDYFYRFLETEAYRLHNPLRISFL